MKRLSYLNLKGAKALLLLFLFAPPCSIARELDEIADLQVTIASTQSVATNGQWVSFSVTARNLGPTPIYAVDDCEIQFSPADGQYGDDGAGGGDPNDAVVSGPGTMDKSWWDIRWFPGAIAPGHAVTMQVSIPLHIRNKDSLHAATATGRYSNSDVTDPNHANNEATLQLGYQPAADLSIQAMDEAGGAWDLVSGPYHVQVVVSNAGASVMTGAVVTNVLPEGCTYDVTWPEDEAYYTFTGNNVLIWYVGDPNESSYDIWPGATPDLWIAITPTNGGSKKVTSTIYHPYDTDSSNNSIEHHMLVSGSSGGSGVTASLQLMGWDVEPEVDRYGTIHYMLRVKNNRTEDTVTGVIVTNTMDSRCVFNSADTPQGTWLVNGQDVVFHLGDVAPEADFICDVYVTPLESGIMTNYARLHLNEPDNEYGDSEVLEETLVREGPYVLTVTPAASFTPTLGFRGFQAIVQTNADAVAGVPLGVHVVRGPHMGVTTNVITAEPEPGAPAMAFFWIEDDAGYPGMDHVVVTGQVGQLAFAQTVHADWQMMDPLTYACTNLGFIVNDGESLFTIYVPDAFEVAALRTGLHFTHTWPTDLEFRLYSPEDYGAPVVEAYLIEELDAFALENLEVGRADAYCLLDDYAAQSISNAVPPFSGSYQSQFREMTNFVGIASVGTWVLVIEDLNPDDFEYGELFGWTLILEADDGDLDNDGIFDEWEDDHGLDSTNPNDADAISPSGVSYRSAYRARRNPADPSSAFAVGTMRPGDTNMTVRWSSVSNQFYAVHWSVNLIDGFGVLASNIFATPPENEYIVTNAVPANAFFFVEQEY
jgi:subtilisin-like proprotein convertase family protein